MEILVFVGMIWAVSSLTLLMLAVLPTKNADTGKNELLLFSPTPGDSLGKHIFGVGMIVLGGPLSWIRLGVEEWMDHRKKKHQSATFTT